MNKFKFFLLPLALLSGGGLISNVAALSVGDAVPSMTLPTATPGSAVDLTKLRGRVVYVDFWASWCGPCKQSFPWMNDMHAKYASRGLIIVAVNVDTKVPDADRFLAAMPAQFTVVFDPKGQTPKLFDVKAMPSSYLIDGDGKVVHVHVGFRDADRAALEAAIDNALAQRRK